MTNEERDLITQFIQRVGGPPAAISGNGGSFTGSVPATNALPPVDREADMLLGDLFQRFPEARYRVTQYAFVQEHALAEAQNAIRQLQGQLSQAQAQLQAQAQQPAPSPWGAAAQPQPARGGLFGMFGNQAAPQPQPQAYAPSPPPPQQPQYAPGYQPGMFQQQGTGFLGSALRAAAGVAGGIFAADALMGLFGGRGGFGGGFGGGGFAGGGNTIVENNFGNAGNNPWGGNPMGGGTDPYDQGGAAKDFDQGSGGGWTDNSGGTDPGGWTDSSGSDPGGFDNSSDTGGFDSDPNSI